VSTHANPASVRHVASTDPAGHTPALLPQVPPRHKNPAGQLFPHCAQFAAFVCKSTHSSPQESCVAGHAGASIPASTTGNGAALGDGAHAQHVAAEVATATRQKAPKDLSGMG